MNLISHIPRQTRAKLAGLAALLCVITPRLDAAVVCQGEAVIELYKQLEKSDREVRSEYAANFQTLLAKSKQRGSAITDEELRAISAALGETDKKNQALLSEIVAACGWPDYEKWGATPVRAALMVTTHAPLEFKLKYLPHIEAAFQRGEITPVNYANIIDKILLRQGKPQKYGTQFILSRDGVKTMRPLENPAQLNNRRQALGMELDGDYPMPDNWPGNSASTQ